MKKEQAEHLSYVNELLSSSELPSMTTIKMHQEHVKRMEEKIMTALFKPGLVAREEEGRDGAEARAGRAGRGGPGGEGGPACLG